jgi:DNA-binding transcriptional MerR regulator
MSLSLKIEKAFKSLSSQIEGLDAMVAGRLSGIETVLRGENPTSDAAASLEAVVEDLTNDNNRLERELRDLTQELEATKVALKEAIEEVWQANESKPIGAVYPGERFGKLQSVGEVIVALGGDEHLAHQLGLTDTATRIWRRHGVIPPAWRNDVERLAKANRYHIDANLFRTMTREESGRYKDSPKSN